MHSKQYLNKIIITAAFICLVLSHISCKKFVNIKPSPNLIQTDQLFTNEATALSAVSGVYVQMRATNPSLANGTLSIYAGLSADELNTSSTTSEYDAFNSNSITATSTIVNSQIWSAAYRIIYMTTTIIENLKKSTAIPKSTRNQLTGEMKVVRSLYYFYLINLFGDVPLVISSDYRKNESKPRALVKEIYEQIINDLNEATSLLTITYPSAGKVRPNKWTAAALLARVYLFNNEWTKAETTSSLVISSGNYTLLNELDAVFKINNTETIWEVAPTNDTRNSVEGSVFIPSTATVVPTLYLNSSLLNSFEPADERKSKWLGFNTVGGNTYYYPYKYKQRTATPVEEYEIVFRLAEQYLLRAEARAQQNKFSEAASDLDIIRNRAGLSNTTATDLNTLLTAIKKERQIELFTEWGDRWLNLKRYGMISAILAPIKGDNWQTTDSIFPIPFNEIQINPKLTQNPGY